MSEFYLKMISSNGVFYEGMCNSLIVPAPDGERAVMAHHEELMIAVTEGEARFRKQEGEDFSCVVVGLERANERLRQKQSIREYHMTRAAMARALARIRETEKYAGH